MTISLFQLFVKSFLRKPLNVSEVHTVRKFLMVRIHTECDSELTCVCRSNLSTKCKDAALALCNLKRICHEYMIVAL